MKRIKRIDDKIKLFGVLCLWYLLPLIYSSVRIYILNDLPDTSALSIAGHIEWFDLINETLQALIIIPIYSILYKTKADSRVGVFKNILRVAISVEFVFSCIIAVLATHIAASMSADNIADVVSYMRLETIGFFFANIIAMIVVYLLVEKKYILIFSISVLEILMKIIGDICLIPNFGANGIALSNICSGVIVLICIFVVLRKQLATSDNAEKLNILEYLKIGSFSGGQILLNNIIYACIICKMINEVAEQGNYWIVNSFIWGFLLLPATACFEIIKSSDVKKKEYIVMFFGIIGFWILSVPFWEYIMEKCLNISDTTVILQLLGWLVPFYLFYILSMFIEGYFCRNGRTELGFIVSLIVNLAYYPIMYGLCLIGVFEPTLHFICMLFGFGMIVSFIAEFIILRIIYKN